MAAMMAEVAATRRGRGRAFKVPRKVGPCVEEGNGGEEEEEEEEGLESKSCKGRVGGGRDEAREKRSVDVMCR